VYTIRLGRLDPHCLGFCRNLQLQQTERKRGQGIEVCKPWKNKDSLGTVKNKFDERNKLKIRVVNCGQHVHL